MQEARDVQGRVIRENNLIRVEHFTNPRAGTVLSVDNELNMIQAVFQNQAVVGSNTICWVRIDDRVKVIG